MKFVLAVLAALAICAPAQAQRVWSQPELDALLAPIALQPDGVVSQVLMAATYPEDVAAAAAWSRANAHLRGDAAVRAAEPEPWDPSVKALLAFPDLLARMDESPQWLHDLGEAFLGQQAQVMDTVQGLRRRAQANGQLVTTNDTAVYQQGEAIVVQPRAEVVYVRYYDPYIVYGPWWWGPYYRPVVWRPWTPYPVVVVRGFFYSQPDWHHHYVRVIHRPVYAHRYVAPVVPGRWEHRAVTTTRAYVRVPESQRRPIVQSHQPMPAANGWSNQSPRRDAVRPPAQAQQPTQPQQQGHPQHRREQRAVEPRRQAENQRARGREQRGNDDRRGGNDQRGHSEQRGHRG